MTARRTMTVMREVVDLRQFRPAQLEDLLNAEAEEWLRDLQWDYRASLQLIRQYIEARILPGYVLVEPSAARPHAFGYGFFVYESQKGLIGDLFVHPSRRTSERTEERKLLGHMVETMQGTPGLRRIEAQLMPFQPHELADSFAQMRFRSYRRLFMRLSLARGRRDGAGGHENGEVQLRPWGAVSFDKAATLINEAYENHIDSEVNDQYRTFAGSLRFLNNVVHYPGCGLFDEPSSFVAVDRTSRDLNGLILSSRVKDDVAHITQICVSPERQGQGIGRMLLEQTAANLRQRKFSAITLTVTEANESAVTLYRRLGFRVLREFDAYVWERN